MGRVVVDVQEARGIDRVNRGVAGIAGNGCVLMVQSRRNCN
jgi:hypothetical protein